MRAAKAEAADERWCVAVDNDEGFGRWGLVEISNMEHAGSALDEAIKRLRIDTVMDALSNSCSMCSYATHVLHSWSWLAFRS